MKNFLKGILLSTIIFIIFGCVATNTLFVEDVKKGEKGYLITINIMDYIYTYYYEQ